MKLHFTLTQRSGKTLNSAVFAYLQQFNTLRGHFRSWGESSLTILYTSSHSSLNLIKKFIASQSSQSGR